MRNFKFEFTRTNEIRESDLLQVPITYLQVKDLFQIKSWNNNVEYFQKFSDLAIPMDQFIGEWLWRLKVG
jgi:hypothetical protein